MVMGGDSFSQGRGFECLHRILDGQFSHLFVVKLLLLFETTKINEKEAGMDLFLKRSGWHLSLGCGSMVSATYS